MDTVATLVPAATGPRAGEPPVRPDLSRRAALAAVIAESRGAVEAALRTRRGGPPIVALALWRAEDRDALQPRFVQLGTDAGDGTVRWGRAVLLRAESRNPLYRAARGRLLAGEADDPAAGVLADLARALSSRVPCHVVDRAA